MSDGSRRLKLGLLANELFSTDVGRTGGFGWAVQQVSRCFADDPALGVDVVILMGKKPRNVAALPSELHGCRILWPNGSNWMRIKRLRAERLDLLLSIDYRPNYRYFFYALPRVPIVIWVRDPRDSKDRAEIATLRIPNRKTKLPQGINSVNAESLKQVYRQSRFMLRSLQFASVAHFLMPKFAGAYGFDPGTVHSLPNIVDPHVGPINKAKQPSVVYLGRLDPIKRPWIFGALAERFPHVEFIFMGQSHFRGRGSWQARNLPANVRLLGHTDGQKKMELLSSAWLIINTSIHESLPVSFLEALACEAPIVACVDPDGVASRFGAFVGNYPGTGLEALPALELVVGELLNDAERRQRLGAEGRAWVNATHNRARFLEAMSNLCTLAGVDVPFQGSARAQVAD